MMQNKWLISILVIFLSVHYSCNNQFNNIEKKNKNNPTPLNIDLPSIPSIVFHHITDQSLVANSRSYIPITSVGTENIYKILEAPKYVTINQDGNIPYLIIDAPLVESKANLVKLEIKTKTDSKIISINLDIKKAINPIYIDVKNQLSQYLIDSITKASTIFLSPGNYGKINISSRYDFPITIIAMAGSEVQVEQVNIENQQNIELVGIHFTGPNKSEDLLNRKAYITIDSTANNINIHNNLFYSTSDSDHWSINDWYNNAINGIVIKGANNIIDNNLFVNLNFPIEISGSGNLLSHNIIDRYEGDAIRNTGNGNSYTYNWISNPTVYNYHDKLGNHDDAIQGWTFGEPIINISIIGNQIFNCIDTSLALKSKVLQGIVCFDGFVDNWQIKDNLLVLDHPHGIALYGAKNCIIDNNIVLKNPYNLTPYESLPWIRIFKHKDGRTGMNNMVNNNYAHVIKFDDSTAVKSHGNHIIPSSLQNLIQY